MAQTQTDPNPATEVTATYADDLDEMAAEIYNMRARSPQEMTPERWARVKELFPASVRSCREQALDIEREG